MDDREIRWHSLVRHRVGIRKGKKDRRTDRCKPIARRDWRAPVVVETAAFESRLVDLHVSHAAQRTPSRSDSCTRIRRVVCGCTRIRTRTLCNATGSTFHLTASYDPRHHATAVFTDECALGWVAPRRIGPLSSRVSGPGPDADVFQV